MPDGANAVVGLRVITTVGEFGAVVLMFVTYTEARPVPGRARVGRTMTTRIDPREAVRQAVAILGLASRGETA